MNVIFIFQLRFEICGAAIYHIAFDIYARILRGVKSIHHVSRHIFITLSRTRPPAPTAVAALHRTQTLQTFLRHFVNGRAVVNRIIRAPAIT